MGAAGFGRSFAPIVQYEKWEIHKVFPHFSYFRLGQNLAPNLLVPLCAIALKIPGQEISARGFLRIFGLFRGKVPLSGDSVHIQNAAGSVLKVGGLSQALRSRFANAEQMGRHGKQILHLRCFHLFHLLHFNICGQSRFSTGKPQNNIRVFRSSLENPDIACPSRFVFFHFRKT